MTAPNQQSNNAATARVAAIDIGSNSIRLTVAESDSDSHYRILTDEKVTARLAASTDRHGNLHPERTRNAAAAVAEMTQTARGHRANTIRAVATAAVRDAPNRQQLIDAVNEAANIETEILGGEEEARLAHDSVAHAFELTHVNAAVLDIGGGSTDIALSTSGVIERLLSLPLGVVRLAETHGDPSHKNHAANSNLRKHIDRTLETHLPKGLSRPTLVFGTGGTFTALAEINLAPQNTGDKTPATDAPPRPATVRGFEARLADIAHTIDKLRRLEPEERAKLPGLSQSRADIIIQGLTIAEAVMRKLHANTLRVHDRGVRDGVILALLREHHQIEQKEHALRHSERNDHRQNAVRFGKRCGFDQKQSQHVAQLAVSIFDQTADIARHTHNTPNNWATEDNRRILETAALLRDVGYFINYKAHHKHSYHLIVHAEIEPFDARQRELIALTARYHRKANPKKKHNAFNALHKDDQHTVRALAAILRVADGLDRTHAGLISKVTLERDEHHTRFLVTAPTNPAADIAGARHKADLYAKTFETHPEFKWTSATEHLDQRPENR